MMTHVRQATVHKVHVYCCRLYSKFNDHGSSESSQVTADVSGSDPAASEVKPADGLVWESRHPMIETARLALKADCSVSSVSNASRTCMHPNTINMSRPKRQ